MKKLILVPQALIQTTWPSIADVLDVIGDATTESSEEFCELINAGQVFFEGSKLQLSEELGEHEFQVGMELDPTIDDAQEIKKCKIAVPEIIYKGPVRNRKKGKTKRF